MPMVMENGLGFKIVTLKLQERAIGWIFGWFLEWFVDECELQNCGKLRKKNS